MPHTRSLSVRSALALGVAVITMIAVLVIVMFLRQAELVRKARYWLMHTYEVIDTIEEFSTRIRDATLYQRNYMLKPEPDFLKAYRRLADSSSDNAVIDNASIAASLDHLEYLTRDNETQQENLAALRVLVDHLRSYNQEVIAMRDSDPVAAVSVANILRGKAILDQIRDLTNVMLAVEKSLLSQRAQIDESRSTRNTDLVIGAIIFFCIAKLILTGLTARQWRRTQHMEHQQHMRALEVTAANEKLQAAYRELEVLNEQIRASGQARLRAVVDHALDGLITIDARGTIESFNPACEKIFGYGAGEVIGRNIKILMPEPYHSGHDGYLSRYHETGKAAIIGTAGREVSAKRKDGSIFPMDLSISSFLLDGKEHFSGILRDITRRKQAENELLRYTKELEHSNQELDDFAYIASHDLKEPLRGLFNHASFLLEDYQDKLNEDGVRRLQRLSKLAQRMEHLVNDLLYFSRLGRADLAVQGTDPNLVVSEIEQMMEAFLKERNAHIVVPNPMPHVVCDRPRITEVFRNLVTNAVKYNDKAEPVVEVGFLGSANAPHGLERNVFYVKDNGIGIEPEFHQEIFRIFKRLGKNEGEEKGTGVGLTFVKKIVERHKGHIWLESKVGQGTTFYFNLNQEGVSYG